MLGSPTQKAEAANMLNQVEDSKAIIAKSDDYLFYLFLAWTYILLGRPQDIVKGLSEFRPALLLGILVVGNYIAKYKNYVNSKFNEQAYLYALLVGAMMVSVPFALYPRGAFLFLFTQYINVILYFLIAYKIINSLAKLNYLLFIGCLASFTYSAAYLILGNLNNGRLYFGEMFDPNDVAFLIISFVPLNFYFLSKNNPLCKRLICVANVALGVIVVVLTGSRGGLIGLSLVLAMLLFSSKQTLKLSYKVLFIGMITTLLLLNPWAININRYTTILNLSNDYNTTDEEGRIEVWKTGLRIMLANPITGVGVTCFDKALGEDRFARGLSPHWQTAHAMVIQIGTETGVLGLVLFCIINLNIIRIFKIAKRMSKSENLLRIATLANVGFMGSIVCGMFLSQAYSIYWAFYVALSAILDNLLQKEGSPFSLYNSDKKMNVISPYSY